MMQSTLAAWLSHQETESGQIVIRFEGGKTIYKKGECCLIRKGPFALYGNEFQMSRSLQEQEAAVRALQLFRGDN